MRGLSKYLYAKLYTILEILLSLSSIMLLCRNPICLSLKAEVQKVCL